MTFHQLVMLSLFECFELVIFFNTHPHTLCMLRTIIIMQESHVALCTSDKCEVMSFQYEDVPLLRMLAMNKETYTLESHMNFEGDLCLPSHCGLFCEKSITCSRQE